MSYQDIYKGVVKQASVEQVKDLAGMIKSARMNKTQGLNDILHIAGSKITPNWVKNHGGRRLSGFLFGQRWDPVNKVPIDVKFSIPGIGNHIKNHSKLYGIGAGAGLLGGGFALGNAGRSDLKAALDRSNTQLEKTTNELNKAKKGTGSFWGDLGNTFGWWLDRLFKFFGGSSDKTSDKTPKVAETK